MGEESRLNFCKDVKDRLVRQQECSAIIMIMIMIMIISTFAWGASITASIQQK